MSSKILNRIRNPRPWIATFSLLLFVLRTYFKIEIVNSDVLVTLILGTLAAWGVWINPGEVSEPIVLAAPTSPQETKEGESNVASN